MPTVPIHLPDPQRGAVSSPLPQLLHTPLGYALLELQGTINFPDATDASSDSTEVGRLVFPDYTPGSDGEGEWMKKAWLFIGYQRMTGAVQKLPKPLALVRKRERSTDGDSMLIDNAQASNGEALDIVEIVRWKVVFRSRPEPVGLATDD